jgi:hypothetical protein
MERGFQQIREAKTALRRAQADLETAYQALERQFGEVTVSFHLEGDEVTVTLARPAPGLPQRETITLSLADMAAVARYIIESTREEEGGHA